MYSLKEKEAFLKREFPKLLIELKEDTKPEWGQMSPQHMVEHLVSSWRIGNGKAKAKCHIPEQKLQVFRDFLFSEEPFEKNIQNPILPKEPAPLRKKNLQEAKEQLLKEVEDFFKFFEENKEAEPTHPVFGELSRSGWVQFQYKHVFHHLKQFDLVA